MMDLRHFAGLADALELLGIAWGEAGQMVMVSGEVPIAAWGHYTDTSQDVVLVNPRVLRWPGRVKAVVIQHELLHYAAYGKAYSFLEVGGVIHDDLANLVLDIVINRILWDTDKGAFRATSRRVYAGVPADSPIALAAGPPEWVVVSPALLELQKYIWEREEIPSPYLLYIRLLQAGFVNIEPWVGGFGCYGAGQAGAGAFLPRKPAGARPEVGGLLGQASRKAIKDIALRGWGSSSLPFSTEFVRGIKGLDVSAVEKLLEGIEARRTIAEAARTIIVAETRIPERSFYTLHPTQTTMVFLAAGLTPDLWPFVSERKRGPQRKAMAVYIDTSRSLTPWREHEVGMVDLLREYFPTRLFVFADEVAEIERDRFAAGDYPQGTGTSFEAVLKHFSEQPEEVAVVFTDGVSWCSEGWGSRLRAAGKRLYVVYLAQKGTPKEKVSSPLDGFAAGRAVLWL